MANLISDLEKVNETTETIPNGQTPANQPTVESGVDTNELVRKNN